MFGIASFRMDRLSDSLGILDALFCGCKITTIPNTKKKFAILVIIRKNYYLCSVKKEYMNIEFDDKALEELYVSGMTNDKKYKKLSNGVIKQYVKAVNYIKAVRRVEDLYTIKSLHYEKKGGDLKGVEAVWINAQYRLLFHSSPDENNIIVNALLTEISKHYE